MNLILKTPDEAPYEEGKDFSVMITCSFRASPNVCQLLQLIQCGLRGEKGRLLYQTWNVEALEFAELRNMGAAEAAQSDMIVIGLAGCQELPTSLADWLWCSCEIRSGRPGALVAVFDADIGPEAAAGMMLQLKAAATLGRLDFFAAGAKETTKMGGVDGIGATARQFVQAWKKDGPGGCRTMGNDQRKWELDTNQIARMAPLL